MKKMMIMIALIGFTAVGSYAQDKNCVSKKKLAVHKMQTKKTVYRKAQSPIPLSASNGSYTYSYATRAIEPCYQYRQHNIVVTECPGTFYNNKDLDNISSDRSFTGYYPKTNTKENKMTAPLAPQRNTNENNKVAPDGGNTFNTGYTPQQL